MKLSLNGIIGCIVIGLVVVNVMVFIRGVALANDIHYYETQIHLMKKDNAHLESRMYELSSITETASLAAQLEYGLYHEPLYLDKPQYAYNR